MRGTREAGITQEELVAEAEAPELFCVPDWLDPKAKDDRACIYINISLGHEGGYANRNPKEDPGGETNWGVTIATARKGGFTGPMISMKRDDAVKIYYNLFWQPGITKHILNEVAFQMYDCSIHSGYGRAMKLLQRTLGVAEDGKLGPVTANALSERAPKQLVQDYLDVREAFLRSLKNAKYNPGWFNRIENNRNIRWGEMYEKYHGTCSF